MRRPRPSPANFDMVNGVADRGAVKVVQALVSQRSAARAHQADNVHVGQNGGDVGEADGRVGPAGIIRRNSGKPMTNCR